MDPLTVDQLAAALQEPHVDLLRQVLVLLGPDHTAQLLAQTLEVEAAGGMLVRNRTRRRTPGGVFFHLVRQQATRSQRDYLFPRSVPQTPQGQAPAQAQLQILTWDEVSTVIQTLATAPAGETHTMKVTLIGRPGKIEPRGQAVLFRMQGKAPASLPRGLPPLPSTPPLTWNVMVALRQWNRVKESLTAHQDDQLIIEGYPLMQGSQHVLLAQSCTSVALQRAQKQAQQQHTGIPS